MSTTPPPLVGLHGETIVLFFIREPLVIPLRMTELDALRFAAQLVAVADPSHQRFPTLMLEALQTPREGVQRELAAEEYARQFEAGRGGDGQRG